MFVSDGAARVDDGLPFVTPGEILAEEFLTDYRLSAGQLAEALGADIALRLALYFGNSPEFWMNLQSNYDLWLARRQLSPEEAARIAAHRAARR